MSERQSAGTRELFFEVEGRAADSETIPVVISSDAVVEVGDGPEILVHTPEAVDLQRAPLPIIATHRGNQINVGLVDNIRFEGGQARGDARFGERQEAIEYKRDVLNRIIRSVSVGYARIKGTLRKDGVLLTTRWMPTHVAMVAEPADVRAGFYRAAPEFEIEKEQDAIRESVRAGLQPAAPAAIKEDNSMSEQQVPAAGAQAATPSVQVTENGFDPGKYEAARAETIRKLAASNDITDERQVMHWVRSGKSWDAIADDILKVREERSKASPAVLGLTPSEKNRFSVVRAINAALSRDWSKAGFEAEVSRAAAQRGGLSLNEFTFIMPHDVLTREMIVGTAASGGYLVGTDIQPQSFIDILRNRSVAMQLGAQTLSGLQGSVTIPTQAASGAVGWLLESGTATENNLTVGQKTLAPKTVGGYQQYSRQLLIQSSMDVERLINNDLAALIALKVDAAVLAGTSTDSSVPLGIRFTSGLGTANPGTATNVSYADMIKLQSTVAASNALFGNFSYVTHPSVAAVLMGKPRFANSDTPVWDGALLDGVMVGKRAMSSLQITSGTMLGGDFSTVFVGEFGPGVSIEANPYANFQAGIVGIRAFYSCDVLVRYGQAFAFGTGIAG
jgi:HK97 family phage major capsid protein